MAITGPIPIILGSIAVTAEETNRIIGFKPYLFKASPDATYTAASPSFKPEAFPAVTVPPSLKSGRSF